MKPLKLFFILRYEDNNLECVRANFNQQVFTSRKHSSSMKLLLGRMTALFELIPRPLLSLLKHAL